MGKVSTENAENIHIYNEKGILQKSGCGFHTVSEFARDNLFYTSWSGRYLCDDRYSVTRDYLNYFSLIYVIEGKMQFSCEGEESVVVEENNAILLDFSKPHYYRSITRRLDKWEMLFNGNVTREYYNLIRESRGSVFPVKGLVQSVMDRLMAELGKPIPEDHSISLLILNLFVNLVNAGSLKLSPPIRKALVYINDHYGEHLEVQDLAEHTALSRSYFSRLFKNETGQTPYEYMMDVRINAAKDMLTERMLSVSEIADRCGFVNTSHFIRVFRENTGQTPAAFRNFFNLK